MTMETTTTYRAADTPDEFVGMHVARDRDDAVAYTQNPGWGGSRVWEIEVKGEVIRLDHVLDVIEYVIEHRVDCSALDRLIEAAQELRDEHVAELVAQWRDEDEGDYRDQLEELIDELEEAPLHLDARQVSWSELGYEHTFHVLEGRDGGAILEHLAQSYDWVEFAEPSVYGDGGEICQTLRRLR